MIIINSPAKLALFVTPIYVDGEIERNRTLHALS